MEEKRLSPTSERRQMWPRGAEFLAASWAFTLSLHSLWVLPITILQHTSESRGALPFLLAYTLLLLLLGLPLLLLEMFLGQYSALPPGRLYRHLSPMLRGLGVAICLQAALRAVMDTACLMWAGVGLVRVLVGQDLQAHLLTLNQTLDTTNSTLDTLDSLGTSLLQEASLDWQLVSALAAVLLLALLLALPGTLLLGKASVLLVPTSFSILIALVVRVSLASPGPPAVLALVWGTGGPDWSTLAQGGLWLRAAAQVVLSLQLGVGGLTAYSSHNRYYHNLVRDCIVIATSHLLWVLLATYLVFCLLGLAHGPDTPHLQGLRGQLVGVVGEGPWLGLSHLLDSSFPSINFSWLWGALFLILILLTGLTSIVGFVKVVSSSLVCAKPSCLPLAPLTTTALHLLLFASCLVFTSDIGVQVYHLLHYSIAYWPSILFTLLTLLASYCHGTNYLLKDLAGMARVRLSHWSSSHTAVTLYTVAPALLTGALCSTLYSLHLASLSPPLKGFGLQLPEVWGSPLAWALAAIPLLPLLLGLLLHIILSGGQSRIKHLRTSFIPTARWYKNEQLDLSSGALGSSTV